MNPPVLHLNRLLEMMRDYSASAHDSTLRNHGETDAVLLGKITLLDVIADSVWTGEIKLTSPEALALAEAAAQLGRAWNHLKDLTESTGAPA